MHCPAWRDTLCRLVAEPGLMPRLRAGVEPPRTMREVTADMHEIYLQVLAEATGSPSSTCPLKSAP